jgi:hypothetical protein
MLDYIDELETKIQYLVDRWPTKLEDGGITFPDGEFWQRTGEGNG